MLVLRATPLLLLLALWSRPYTAATPQYECSRPLLGVTFNVTGGRYSGAVACGSLLLATDIPQAPVVQLAPGSAREHGGGDDALFALIMVDFDGNANGSWPDAVPPGANSPVRHWVVRDTERLRELRWPKRSAAQRVCR